MLLFGSCFASEMAKIKANFNNLVTSSTLSWVSVAEGKDSHLNGVPIDEDGPLWCRGRQHAVWVSGAVINGKCHVPFLSNVYTLDTYDILVSINGFARMDKVPWDSYNNVPHNAIATPERMLAIYMDNDTTLAGYVYSSQRKAYFLKDGESIKTQDAIVITEVEPVKYTLDNVVMDESKEQIGQEDSVEKDVVLENNGDSEMEISKIVDYTEVLLHYWGKVKGTVTARQAEVTYPSHIKTNIQWNIENQLDKTKQQEISFTLPPGTAVKAQLIAVVQKYEAPYNGILTAIYKDDKTISRNITALHIDFRPLELRVEFQQPYYIENKTAVEDIEPVVQILIHSTTTTTTTTTHPPEDKPQPDHLASNDNDDESGGGNTSQGASVHQHHLHQSFSILVSSSLLPVSLILLNYLIPVAFTLH